jgi:lantibiotic modifying enzyme
MSSEYLDAAEAIGRRVVADAVWHEGRCNWVGVAMDPKEPWQAEYRALEPNVYDGSAGVGVFLAQLAAVTGDADARRTAAGAMRHALARAPAYRSEGLYAGCLGIAWAAARAAELLDDEDLQIAARAVPHPIPDRCPDVVAGAAGSILARLALAEALDDPASVDDAIGRGEELLASAPWRLGRSGLCHGTDGVGVALLELFAATGDERFRAGAGRAFEPQRRRRGTAHRHARLASPMIGSWCEGEGGIALIRRRAVDILGPSPYEQEAAGAVDTVRDALVAALPYDFDDVTLCHGACGAADVLLQAGDDEVPTAFGDVALERYGHNGRWPCSPLGGTTPGLFRGLTGIGWFYLRLFDPAVPSPLALPALLTRAAPSA